MIRPFAGGGLSPGGMTIAVAWVMAGDAATPVNRDGGITGGEEIRPAEGDWAVVALALGTA